MLRFSSLQGWISFCVRKFKNARYWFLTSETVVITDGIEKKQSADVPTLLFSNLGSSKCFWEDFFYRAYVYWESSSPL